MQDNPNETIGHKTNEMRKELEPILKDIEAMNKKLDEMKEANNQLMKRANRALDKTDLGDDNGRETN